MEKPLLVYDGNCSFCKYWILRLINLTQDHIAYKPYQEVTNLYPQIPEPNFTQSIYLIRTDGTYTKGAEAFFEALHISEKKWPLWFYRKIPGFRFLSELCYRKVAENRSFFSHVTQTLWGTPEISTYQIAQNIFLKMLGLVYFFAFLSLALQIKGLIGSGGILPAQDFLKIISQHTGLERYWFVPTLFWLENSDLSLQLVSWLGVSFSLLLILGINSSVILFVLWLFYLSLFYVGQTFLGYQWDTLLLETGFLAIFFASRDILLRKNLAPSPYILFLLRWLLFRLMLSSGLVKLTSGDPNWRNLSALTYHYETQPLPHWISYYANLLPTAFQKLSCTLMFVIELAIPFLIFAPRKLRQIGAFTLIGFQTLIFLTGNYNFFNLLTITLCVILLDDSFFRKFRFLKKLSLPSAQKKWPKKLMIPFSIFIFSISWIPFLTRIGKDPQVFWPLQKTYEFFHPFNLVNGYGLFAVMTTKRSEIIIEGSNDGNQWLAYEFKWKPGNLNQRPGFVEPFQPRLDWQMWFQALRPYQSRSWFGIFLTKLLEGSPDVLALLKNNPFPDHPPQFIRAVIADYHFTNLDQKKQTGNWWWKEVDQTYSPTLSLNKN